MSLKHPFIIALVGLFLICSGGSLFAQNVWETTPVFHNGRVMLLHTFARQVVRQICGSERPFLVRDDAAISDFNQVIAALKKQDQEKQDFGDLGSASTGYSFLNPNATLDGGMDRHYSHFKIASDGQQIQTTLPIQGLSLAQIERIADRVRQLIPMEGRYVEASELLISLICEPEVWAYVPIFLVPDSEYLQEFFDVSFAGDRRTSQYRVSLHQLEKSQRYKQRCAEIQRRKKLGQATNNSTLFDQITERLESQSRAFLDLTFHPQRQLPTRMLEVLIQTTSEQSSCATALDAWAYLLSLGEIPGRQATEQALHSDELMILHPTTHRWHEIADKLRFMTQIYGRTDSVGNPILPNAPVVEQQYEILIDLIDTNLAEAAALMETVYPGVSYRLHGNDHAVNVERLLPKLNSPENQGKQAAIRRIAISYYYSTKKLRNEVEAAYLALYDNGLSFRFLPLASPLVLEMGITQNNLNVQPWASATMILGSGETFVKRFLDPKSVHSRTDATKHNSTLDEASLPMISDETEDADAVPSPEKFVENRTQIDLGTPSSLERDLFQTHGSKEGNIRMILANQVLIGTIRSNMWELLLSYTAHPGREYGHHDSYRAVQLQQAVRDAAALIEKQKKPFVNEENRQITELFAKTTYPDFSASKKLLKEYRYNRLHPFFWMGVFALLALLLNGGSCIVAAARDKSAVVKTVSIHSTTHGKNEEKQLPDYTNSIEEWLFISSIGMLMLAIMIAFIGGVMRAGITGWIPVTNMYETVVMMALSSAILGVWYALHPILHPALQLALFYSKFPNFSTWQEWFAAAKMRKTAISSLKAEGEAAMRGIAEEFGIPGGMTIGDRRLGDRRTAFRRESEGWEAQHVNAALRKVAGQCLLTAPRLILTFATFYWIVVLANGSEYVAEHDFFASAVNVFAANSFIDSLTIIACVGLMLWYIPYALLTLLVMPVVLCRPSWIAAEHGIQSFETTIIVEPATKFGTTLHMSSVLSRTELSGVFRGEAQDASQNVNNSSGEAWFKQARNAALERKLFIAVTAGIVCVVALIASTFNPDIRPIAAVLRSNFWLTVHVTAIIVSYAAAFIAWGTAAVSLGYVVFGRYQRIEPGLPNEKPTVFLPAPCQVFAPIIEMLLKMALLLLIVGTVLGARWADYAWGRFWSWDPKEVWALITILFFAIVLHGKTARYYGAIGITVGALFASIAVIITWYGVNFIFNGSVHAYGGGSESSATLFLFVFIAVNLLWGTLALLRYVVEVHGSEADA